MAGAMEGWGYLMTPVLGECVVCGNAASSKWTLNNGSEAAIAELCDQHAAPLSDVLRRGVVDGPRDEARAHDRRPAPRRGRGLLEPFKWTPPED